MNTPVERDLHFPSSRQPDGNGSANAIRGLEINLLPEDDVVKKLKKVCSYLFKIQL